jgi:hypothetical protein
LDIAEGLRATRQVIVLEAVERAFLKTAGGFEAVRALMELIDATAPSALWIVVVSARCFELLDAVLDMGSFFSHRINAMGVRSEVLERAILQRHYLSGLKLSFSAQKPGLLARFGWKNDPQKAFFASLHRQSGGNFRSALELWQSAIESTEGGVIRLGQPAAPDFRAVREDLGQADHFTLLSLEQHGSLTAAELARVLCEPEQASRARLERLARMGILERDGEEAGMRVRAPAQRIVEEVLESVNLI